MRRRGSGRRRGRRDGRLARVGHLRAARMEHATGRRIERAWQFALDDRARARFLDHRIGHRGGGEQGLRVGVLRVGEQLIRRRIFNDAAEIHDGDLGRDVPHDGEIMGDEQIGQPELVLQVLEQVDDLALDRHVERGDGLVADDQLRIDAERARDADALALPA